MINPAVEKAEKENIFKYEFSNEVRERILRIACSFDGKHIAATTTNGKIIVWNYNDKEPYSIIKGHTNNIYGLSWSFLENILATASSHSIKIWDANKKQLISVLEDIHSQYSCLEWDKSRGFIIAGCVDGAVCLWDINEKQQIIKLPIHDNKRILTIKRSPCGKFFASGGSDGTIIIWRIINKRLFIYRSFSVSHTQIYDINWTPDSKQICYCSKGNFINFIDIKYGIGIKQININSDYNAKIDISALDVSPCGRYLAYKLFNGELIIFDLRYNKVVSSLRDEHSRHTSSICFITNQSADISLVSKWGNDTSLIEISEFDNCQDTGLQPINEIMHSFNKEKLDQLQKVYLESNTLNEIIKIIKERQANNQNILLFIDKLYDLDKNKANEKIIEFLYNENDLYQKKILFLILLQKNEVIESDIVETIYLNASAELRKFMILNIINLDYYPIIDDFLSDSFQNIDLKFLKEFVIVFKNTRYIKAIKKLSEKLNENLSTYVCCIIILLLSKVKFLDIEKTINVKLTELVAQSMDTVNKRMCLKMLLASIENLLPEESFYTLLNELLIETDELNKINIARTLCSYTASHFKEYLRKANSQKSPIMNKDKLRERDTIKSFIYILHDENEDRVKNSKSMLNTLINEKNKPFFIECLKSEDPLICNNLARLLKNRLKDKHFDFLTDAFKTGNDKTKEVVIKLLAEINSDRAIKFIQHYNGYISPHVTSEIGLHLKHNFNDLYKKIVKIIAEKLEIDESIIRMEASFRQDLGADSVETFELIYVIEEEIGVRIPDDKANEFETVGDAFNYIQAQLRH